MGTPDEKQVFTDRFNRDYRGVSSKPVEQVKKTVKPEEQKKEEKKDGF
jgi:hypothetical protein